MPFDFLRLPMTAGAAVALFAESGDSWTWLGSAVIFASSLALARTERRERLEADGHKAGFFSSLLTRVKMN